ncbi:hypothetical protein LINPERHAP1_LOCUS29706 [Linum perenne]
MRCNFFVWYDVKVAAAKDKQDLVRLVDFLQNRIVELETENKNLRTRFGEQADMGSSETNVTTELEMLTKKGSHLEISLQRVAVRRLGLAGSPEHAPQGTSSGKLITEVDIEMACIVTVLNTWEPSFEDILKALAL